MSETRSKKYIYIVEKNKNVKKRPQNSTFAILLSNIYTDNGVLRLVGPLPD